MKIITLVLGFAALLLFVDFAGFCLWVLSGQYPSLNGYYIGKITVELLRLII